MNLSFFSKEMVLPWRHFVIGAYVLFIVLAMLGATVADAALQKTIGTVAGAVFLFLLFSFAIWFIWCVTGDSDEQHHAIFQFAYAFTFAAFGFLALPLVGIWEDPARYGALGLMRACAVDGSDQDEVSLPRSMRCPTGGGPLRSLPWVVAIGGTVVMEEIPAAAVAKAAAAKDAAPKEPPKDSGSKDGGQKDPAKDGEPKEGAPKAGGGAPSPAQAQGSVRVDDRSPPLYKVQGGLIVPFYVLVLAFIGGAVSLSRRIPELQKRSEDGYVGTAAEPKLTANEAREFVVFQIMQLISAPFIAIAAYYIVGPRSTASAVGLAFGAGFASEPILLMIRSVVNGIKPSGAKVQDTVVRRQVSGSVVASTGNPAPGAEVSIPALKVTSVKTDGAGKFVLEGVPEGQHLVVAKLGSAQGASNVLVKDANLTDVRLELKPLIAVKGKVVDAATGAPVDGATVKVDKTSIASTTGQDGAFELQGVPAEQQTIVAEKPGRKKSQPVAVAEGMNPIEIKLP